MLMNNPDKNAKKRGGGDQKPSVGYTGKDIVRFIKQGDISLCASVFHALDAIFVYLFVKLFAWLAYDRKYLRGKAFRYPWSPGYRWAFNGMFRKLFTGHGRGVKWPIGPMCDCARHVNFDPEDIGLFARMVRYQAMGDAWINLGKDVHIAQGCNIITTNHDPSCPSQHLEPQSITIEDHCWLGANVTVLPGVTLGPYTTVGANAVVTKSFPEGHCILAGVPAQKIRDNEPVRVE